MGFNDKKVTGPSTRYLTPAYRIIGASSLPSGVFVEAAKAGDPNATARVNKIGATVYEYIYNCSLTGKIVNSTIEMSRIENIGYTIKCMLLDENFERWQIEFPVRSSYGRSYLQKMYSINTEQDVTIEPYAFIPKDKVTVASGLQIYQFDGERLSKVVNWYSQENPNGVPDAVPTVYKGKPSWDDTERVNYLMSAHDQWANQAFAGEKRRIFEMRSQYAQQAPVQQAPAQQRQMQPTAPVQQRQAQPTAPVQQQQVGKIPPRIPQQEYPTAPGQSAPRVPFPSNTQKPSSFQPTPPAQPVQNESWSDEGDLPF